MKTKTSIMILSAFALCVSASAFELKVESYAATQATPALAAPELKTLPVLDGKLDDAAWKNAAVIDNLVTTSGGKPDVRTTVYVAFDAKYIYVAFDCEEPEMDRLRIGAQAGEDKWPGDCVEVFLDIGRGKKDYYQFVTSSKGARNDYMNGGTGIWWDGKNWKTVSGITGKGWCVEIAIPWSDLAINDAQREQTWGINVTRERTLTEKGASPPRQTLLTWVPMPSFGSPSDFGAVFFGPKEEYDAGKRGTQLQGLLDKLSYSKNDRIAQLALNVLGGEPKGSTLTVQIDRLVGGEMLHKASAPVTSSRLGVDVPIASLDPGQYTLRAQTTDTKGRASNALSFPLHVAKASATAQSGEITLTRSQVVKAGVDRWQARAGVPFPDGALRDAAQVALFTSDGKPVPAQARSLATWSKDGTVKWLGVDFQTPLGADRAEKYTLRYGPDVKANAGGSIKVSENDKTIVVETGAAKFSIRKQGFNFIDEMSVGGKPVIASDGKNRGPFMADEQGKTFWAALDPTSTVTVKEQNPMRTVIRAEGWHSDGQGRNLGRYVVHLYFYSGLPYFRAQHTFILAEDTDKTRYTGIGLALPAKANEVRFGGVNDPIKGSGYLLQKKWDEFVVSSDNKPVANGAKADGSIMAGDLAVVVRDFWQNFPKELEATTDGLTVHFWPKHGERVWTEEKEIQVEEAYMLPFVHQGKVLDFKMPERYFNGPLTNEYGFAYPDGKGGWKLHYGAEAKKTNAMGLGKTHDMLIAFGEAAQPQRVAALREAFQQDVHFLPDPKWSCETKVVGEMPPVDKDRFPYQEAYISNGFDFLMRWTWDATHAYGMFNYGDSYHVIANKETLRPGYYRLWAGYHHGRARVPWLFYLRSGDPKYFQWARANAQHLMDVDTCHFTTPEFESANETARKLVGGLCDYKGIVHWSTGARVGDYNNMLDFLLLDYYLTGNERALDVVHETGQLLIRFAVGTTQREGCSLGALLDYYKHTWNANALLKFTAELPKVYKAPAITHNPPSIQWGPFLEPWIAYNGDPEAKRFLMELADTLLDPEQTFSGVRHYGDGRALAMAYELTGERKYLDFAWGYYNRGPNLFDVAGHPQRHVVDWLNWSFELQQCLPVMAHLRRFPERPTLAQPRYGGRGSVSMMLHASPSAEIRALLTEEKDGDFWVGAGRFFTRKELQYELINPAGKVVQGGVIPPSNVGAERFKAIQMKDGQTGEYALRVFGPDEFLYETTHISSLGTQRFVFPKLDPKDEFFLGGRFFFFVPADCQKFTFKVSSSEDKRNVMTVNILTPEDRVLVHRSLVGTDGPQVIEVTPDAAFRGKVWSLAASGCRIIEVQGLPQWFASHHAGAVMKTTDPVAAAK